MGFIRFKLNESYKILKLNLNDNVNAPKSNTVLYKVIFLVESSRPWSKNPDLTNYESALSQA